MVPLIAVQGSNVPMEYHQSKINQFTTHKDSRMFFIDYVLLTKSITDCNCMVLLFMEEPLGIMHCYANGDRDWAFIDYQEELKEFRGGYDRFRDKFTCPVVIDDDKMMMISNSEVVAMFETTKPKGLVIRPYLNFPKLHPHVLIPSRLTIKYWVANCGDLFVIHVTYGEHACNHIVSIDIFKLDFSDMTEKMVDSCPNTAFFLRGCFVMGRQSMACPIAFSDSSKVGNRVYIIEDDHNDDNDDQEVRLLLHTYHIQQKTLKTSLIATSKNEFEPYWMLVSDSQVLTEVEVDYCSGEDCRYDQLFAKRENTKMMMLRNNHENEENKFSIMLEGLPVDILKTISSHLIHLSNYLNFRATKKKFRDIFSKKEWIYMRAAQSYTNQSPWLIFPKSRQVGKCVFSMVDLVPCNKYNVRTPEILAENSRICYSANGWLLMSSSYIEEEFQGLNLVFYNPITMSTICLPQLPASNASHFLFIGSPDYQEDCIIVGVSHEYSAYYIISKESNGDEWEEWAEAELTIEYNDGVNFNLQQSNVNVVHVGEFFCFLVGGGKIAYISSTRNTLGIHSLEEPCIGSSYERYFLAACDEDLISIYIGKEWKWLRAFKFNEPDMIWDEVKELKNNNVYLSYVSSTVLKPQSLEAGNIIYFSRFYRDSIIYYSFNTQNFHISDGKDSVMNDCYELEEQMHSCWIEPRWEVKE